MIIFIDITVYHLHHWQSFGAYVKNHCPDVLRQKWGDLPNVFDGYKSEDNDNNNSDIVVCSSIFLFIYNIIACMQICKHIFLFHIL